MSSCGATALTSAFDTWLTRLYAVGAAVTGAVRYSVSEASNDQWPAQSPQSALTYPLADPTSIATPPFSATAPHTASGADATALRAVRAAYQAAAPPVPPPQYAIPVKVDASNSAPRYFDLALRDTVPFERDGALAVEAFIQ